MNKSHYGKPRKPVHLSNVNCTGSEEQILSCTHTEFTSLDEKKEALNVSDVAGVICQPSSTSGNLASSSISRGPVPTRLAEDQNTNINNHSPENPTISSTYSNQTTDELPGELILSVIPNYLISFVLTVGLLVATILAIV